MKEKSRSFVQYLVMAPSLLAMITIVLCGFLLITAEDRDQLTFAFMLAFALSELLMILSAAAGITYLLSKEKQKQWLLVNVFWFFTGGIAGVFSFLAV